jgi:DNA-binding transcriptional MerR regulator
MGMRISELAQRSGVSVPTIKYYLRVGLLPSGTTTAHNQATYGETHLRRLRLIRALLDIGGLTVLATRDVLAAIDDSTVSGLDLLAIVDSATAAARCGIVDESVRDTALTDVTALIAGYGWRMRPGVRAIDRLAEICAAVRLLEVKELYGVLDAYAGAAAQVAECDLAVTRALAERVDVAPQQQRVILMEAVVATVVLGGAMLATLHTMAREDALSRLFAEEPQGLR